MPHCEAPVIDGRCPFDRDALPEPGPTPATHFALSTAPDAATALLLPFAEHPWHSRVVAALREDAALSTADDDGAEFVLVTLPEHLRPSVRDALAALLDLRARDRRVHCGISCLYSGEYTAALTAAFTQLGFVNVADSGDGTVTDDDADSYSDTSEDWGSESDQAPAAMQNKGEECGPNDGVQIEPSCCEDVAAVCQLCRAGEFLQCFTITDLACQWLGWWLEHVTKTERHPEFIRLALQCLCDADMARPARAVAEKLDLSSFVFAPHPELDPTFLSTMLSAEFSFGYIGCIATAIPAAVLDYIPPCALPHRVVETQLPCWFANEGASQGRGYRCRVFHGTLGSGRTSHEPYFLFVGQMWRAKDHKNGTLCFDSWANFHPFLPHKADGIVIPPGIVNYEAVFANRLFSSATSITFPCDFRDEHWGSFASKSRKHLEQLDLSQTQITTIPGACCRWPELALVYLPLTLQAIHAGAFSSCGKLHTVSGLHRGVTIHSTAFAFSRALPVSTFTDLPEAPSDAACPRSARKKRPRND